MVTEPTAPLIELAGPFHGMDYHTGHALATAAITRRCTAMLVCSATREGWATASSTSRPSLTAPPRSRSSAPSTLPGSSHGRSIFGDPTAARRSGLRHEGILQHTQAIDLHPHHLTRAQ